MQEIPGTIVVARARRQVILGVVDHGECQSVRLAPLDPRGAPLTLLHPFDPIARVTHGSSPRRCGRRRVAHACAAAICDAHDAGELWSAADARVQILPYQLEPALAVVRGGATRILLADEVGLGKTIQAGLILSELRARNALTRALVLTPAGLREQWAQELRDRFRIDSCRMDAARLAGLQRSLPPWINPWTLAGVVVASIDLLKREEVLAGLAHVTWDAVIVDEAHHASAGTDRRAAAALVCSRSRVAVIVTATPHDGDPSSLAHLRDLGASTDGADPLLLFRRTRADVADGVVPRRTRLLTVARTPAERALHAQLDAYTSRVWRETAAASDARLAMIVLRKRALSGAASLARSLARRLEALEGEAPSTASRQLLLDFRDTLDGELIGEDAEPVAGLGAPGLRDARTEHDLLEALLDATRAAMAQDAKLLALARALARTAEPVIVFTEYRDTLDDLRRRLTAKTPLTVLHGAMTPAERERALETFARGAARLLLATDAAAEGLNLQQRCRWVIHYEVPWSASRLDQRNGRVDRLGQSRRVHVWHLLAAPSEETGLLARVMGRAQEAAHALADEGANARYVFGERDASDRDPRASPADHLPAERHREKTGEREARRLAALRRLPAEQRIEPRPLMARVRCRGTFALLPRGWVLAVWRAHVLDAGGHRCATLAAGIAARDLVTARRLAGRRIGRWVRRSVAVHLSVSRRAVARDLAIEAALGTGAGRAIQPSLFDRRALAAADHETAERDRALAEISSRRVTRSEGLRRHTVRIALVGAFVAR